MEDGNYTGLSDHLQAAADARTGYSPFHRPRCHDSAVRVGIDGRRPTQHGRSSHLASELHDYSPLVILKVPSDGSETSRRFQAVRCMATSRPFACANANENGTVSG